MDTSDSPPSLPLSWHSTTAALGGVDLRVTAGGRRYIAISAAVLAMVAGWRTILNWQVTPGSRVPWLGITLLLGFFAVWCAFADELWHIERNCLEHRVGIGRCALSRRYRDADLQILLGFSTQFSRRFYRLYAIENSTAHFLIERDEPELRQLTLFISFHTGWSIRPLGSYRR